MSGTATGAARADRRTRPAPGGRLAADGARRHAEHLGLVLAGAAVLAQVAYPLLHGRALTAATIAGVLLFAAAVLAGATAAQGPRATALLAVAAVSTGLLAEAVGVATGVPFGRYAYTGTLGPQVLGVPVVVPAAWLMMAWPCLVAGRALAGGRSWAAVPVAAWALASWDLFLDPQMVAAGHWRWASPSPSLPGVPGIPLTNFAGWLVVALLLEGLLHAVLPRAAAGTGSPGARQGTSAVPAVLLAWTWLGSTLAAATFFGRPAVAAWGFVAMGAVVGPYLLRRRGRGAR